MYTTFQNLHNFSHNLVMFTLRSIFSQKKHFILYFFQLKFLETCKEFTYGVATVEMCPPS